MLFPSSFILSLSDGAFVVSAKRLVIFFVFIVVIDLASFSLEPLYLNVSDSHSFWVLYLQRYALRFTAALYDHTSM